MKSVKYTANFSFLDCDTPNITASKESPDKIPPSDKNSILSS